MKKWYPSRQRLTPALGFTLGLLTGGVRPVVRILHASAIQCLAGRRRA